MIASIGLAVAADVDPLFDGINDFGDVGLMQTPTARMHADGEFGFGISSQSPYNQAQAFLQVLPWVETTLRYTDVTNHLQSPGQTYKDRSADLKLKLLSESHYLPAVALGFQDLGGTGLFSGQYLVADYHYYALDFSLGMGWGRIGAGGHIKNPFSLVSNHFNTEPTDTGAGGTGLNRLFTGPDVGLFGGVRWNTPVPNLSLKVEYDGNNYQHEPFGDELKQNLPVNFGLGYRFKDVADLNFVYERGYRLGFNLALHTNLQQVRGPAKTFDPPPLPVRAAPPASASSSAAPPPAAALPAPSTPMVMPTSRVVADDDLQGPPISEAILGRALTPVFKEQGFELLALRYVPELHQMEVWYRGGAWRNPEQVVGRLSRALSIGLPPQVQSVVLIHMDQGVETHRVRVPRAVFEQAVRGEIDVDELIAAIKLTGPEEHEDPLADAAWINPDRFPAFDWDTGPKVRQQIGGADGLYYGQILWQLSGNLNVTDHLSFSSGISANIWNNFNKITVTSNSELPHVRSDITSYLQKGPNSLDELETDYIWSPHDDWYARGSAGIFEQMYTGAAAQLMYKPYGSRFAIGLDVNHLWQRGFDERLDLLGYNVTTAFADIYYEIPYANLLAHLTVGRYLARDHGATFDLSRQFASGVRAGIFATKTNVSAAEFGEGSFDKGVYLSIPLDLLAPKSSHATGELLFRPLTRDGGQRARDGIDLYTVGSGVQPNDYAQDPIAVIH